MITGALFSFFSKLLGYYYLKDKSKAAVASQLKVNPFFVDKYQMAAKNYTGVKVAQIISILREYDMKSKGFGNTGTPEDRKSTRLNSSHVRTSYAVFCLKKKT